MKKLFLLILALLPFLSNAQTAEEFFMLGTLGPTSTMTEILTLFGKPTKIDTSKSDQSMVIKYDLTAKEDYDFGWVWFYVNPNGIFISYDIKVGKSERGTNKMLEVFKNDLKLNSGLLSLFNMDYKAIENNLKGMGYVFYPQEKDGSKYAWFIHYQSKTGKPAITLTIGDGKNYEMGRKEKLYELKVTF